MLLIVLSFEVESETVSINWLIKIALTDIIF